MWKIKIKSQTSGSTSIKEWVAKYSFFLGGGEVKVFIHALRCIHTNIALPIYRLQVWESVVMENPESGEKTWKNAGIWAKIPQNRLKIKTWNFLHPNTWIHVQTWKFSCLSVASRRSITAFQVKMNFNFHATPQYSIIAISVKEEPVRQRTVWTNL